MKKKPVVQFEINSDKFLSALNYLRTMKGWAKYPDFLNMEAHKDGLKLQGITADNSVTVLLEKKDSYRYVSRGSVSTDIRMLLKALDGGRNHDSLTVRYENDTLSITKHEGRLHIALPGHPLQQACPIGSLSDCPSVSVPANHLLHGISKVAFATHDCDPNILPQYMQICIHITSENVVFYAGNGSRFVLYRITAPIGIPENELHTVHLPISVVKTLLKVLRSGYQDPIQFMYNHDESKSPLETSLTVLAGNIHMDCLFLYNKYPDVRNAINTIEGSYEATMDRKSWDLAAAAIKASIAISSGWGYHGTKMTFDFTKGNVVIAVDHSTDIPLGLALGQNTKFCSNEAPITIECNSWYLLDMYKDFPNYGHVVLRFNDPKLHKRCLVAVDYPTVSSNGVTEEFQMLIAHKPHNNDNNTEDQTHD